MVFKTILKPSGEFSAFGFALIAPCTICMASREPSDLARLKPKRVEFFVRSSHDPMVFTSNGKSFGSTPKACARLLTPLAKDKRAFAPVPVELQPDWFIWLAA